MRCGMKCSDKMSLSEARAQDHVESHMTGFSMDGLGENCTLGCTLVCMCVL